MICPLCNYESIEIIETIKKHDIIKLYTKLTHANFDYLIKKDIKLCKCNHCKIKFYDPMVVGDEKFYNSLQKFDWYYLNDKCEYDYAKKYISCTDKVLEVGSGKGAFAKKISTKKYIGLDFSINAKKLAAKNGIMIRNETIEDYAIKHCEEMDCVVSFQVLEHVPNPKSFIEAKLKTLKVGGKMIVAVPSEDSFLKYAFNNILNMPPHHVTRWSDEVFVYMANRYNLKIINIYHEKVQDIHKQWYVTTLVLNALFHYRTINMSVMQKIVAKFLSFFSKLSLQCLHDEVLPNGHTVLVVFEKQ